MYVIDELQNFPMYITIFIHPGWGFVSLGNVIFFFVGFIREGALYGECLRQQR